MEMYVLKTNKLKMPTLEKNQSLILGYKPVFTAILTPVCTGLVFIQTYFIQKVNLKT